MKNTRLRRALSTSWDFLVLILSAIGFLFGIVIVCASPHPFLIGAIFVSVLVAFLFASHQHLNRENNGVSDGSRDAS